LFFQYWRIVHTTVGGIASVGTTNVVLDA